MNTQPQTIIEINTKLNSKDKEKLQNLLEIVFDIDTDDLNIYDSKYYSIESSFADVIANASANAVADAAAVANTIDGSCVRNCNADAILVANAFAPTGAGVAMATSAAAGAG